jgi:DNA-binding IclR family transcriptional regulator
MGQTRDRQHERTVSSVDNALILLLAFKDRPSISVTEGAELLGVAPSTAHRLLSTLQSHGFVRQEAETRRYRAGAELLDVALGALRSLDVLRVARPHLEQLRDEVRETVNLILLDGSHIRFIDSVEGPEAVRVSNRTGTVLPAHCTAGGKMLLASLSVPQLRHLYGLVRLPGLTHYSITDREVLFRELAEVRRLGYATNFEQSMMGVSAVAVPITDPSGRVVASIGISAPTPRLDDHRVQAVVKAGRRTAEAVTAALRESSEQAGR